MPNLYDEFVRSGQAAGFTDSQINWMWEWMGKMNNDLRI